MRFLYQADLIGKVEESGEQQIIEAIIDLRSADLIYANLIYSNLSGANLSGTNLNYANLRGVHLISADLTGADLSGARLSSTNLNNADLSGAYLTGAIYCTNEQLAQARSLFGATMPDRTKMTVESWKEFKKRYRQ